MKSTSQFALLSAAFAILISSQTWAEEPAKSKPGFVLRSQTGSLVYGQNSARGGDGADGSARFGAVRLDTHTIGVSDGRWGVLRRSRFQLGGGSGQDGDGNRGGVFNVAAVDDLDLALKFSKGRCAFVVTGGYSLGLDGTVSMEQKMKDTESLRAEAGLRGGVGAVCGEPREGQAFYFLMIGGAKYGLGKNELGLAPEVGGRMGILMNRALSLHAEILERSKGGSSVLEVGGGVEARLSPKVVLGLDLRHSNSRDQKASIPEDEKRFNTVITGTVGYAFE